MTYPSTPVTLKLNGLRWATSFFLDQNANGVQDAEDEGVEGAIVNLLVDDEVVATTSTNEDGFYEFTELTPGEEYPSRVPNR